MKIGDLVRFNAAGQKRKTLGVVIDLKKSDGKISHVHVCWTMTGEKLPKIDWRHDGDIHWHYEQPDWTQIAEKMRSIRSTPTPKLWHSNGPWLEVIKPAKKCPRQ